MRVAKIRSLEFYKWGFLALGVAMISSLAFMGETFVRTKNSLLEFSDFQVATRSTARALMQVRQQLTQAKAECSKAIELGADTDHSLEAIEECTVQIEAASSQIRQEKESGEQFKGFSESSEVLLGQLEKIQKHWQTKGTNLQNVTELREFRNSLQVNLDAMGSQESLFWTAAANEGVVRLRGLQSVQIVLVFASLLFIVLFTLCFCGLVFALYATKKVVHIQNELLETKRALDLETAKNLHSSKLHSLGELAGGIGHEINNPLAVIMGRMVQSLDDLMGRNPNDTAPYKVQDLQRLFDLVMRHCERILKILKSLQKMSRKADSDPFVPISVDSLLKEILTLSVTKSGTSSVQITLQNIPIEPIILGRDSELGQVFINLINNSFDAIIGKPNPWIEVLGRVTATHLILRFMDSGNGIPQKDASRLFEPFFTTKEKNKGTGLGMSISRQILLNHKGEIYLDTDCKNTCFVVQIPLLTKE